MKRAGFTMIELIFVIVILGILASVAVPKLIGVKESADEGLIKGFVGTLNRTVGASKWSTSLLDGQNGSVANGSYNITTADTEFPSSFSTVAAGAGLNLANCNDNNATAGDGDVVGSSNDGNFDIICRDGSDSQAPKFWYTETNTSGTFPTDGSIKM